MRISHVSRGVAGALLGLVLFELLPARAAESLDVLIVGSGSPELARKLRAEAVYAGFTPLERPPAHRASTRRVPATLRVLSSERVELSVDRVDAGTHFEQTFTSRPGERGSFALRVIAQLRARLVDVGWTLPSREAAPDAIESRSTEESASSVASGTRPSLEAGPGRAAPQTAGEALTERAPDAATRLDAGAPSDGPDASAEGSSGRAWLAAGIANSWARGFGAVPHALLGVRIELGGAWHAAALSWWPLSDIEVEASEGEARMAWTGFTATIERALPLSEPWFARGGLGAGLFVLDARGVAAPDYDGRRERLYSGVFLADVGAGRELTSWLRLRASALGGVTAPRPVLRFDEREVASLGRFVGAIALGIELSWPSAPRLP